jgi:P-type Ca2+ transporter type 2C
MVILLINNMPEKGLSSKEAKALLVKYGPNEIKDISKRTPLKILLEQIKGNFIFYILVFAMVASFAVGKDITGYVLGVVILMVVGVSFVQEYKSEKAIQLLKNMIVPISIALRDGKECEVLSSELVPGDIIILRGGDRVPADCVVLHENELRLNEAMLTGEASEIKKRTITTKEPTEENSLFMGTYIVNGKGVARVIHTGMNTRFGKISKLISTAEKDMPLQRKVNKIAKYMTVIAITLSTLTALFMIAVAPEITDQVLIDSLILAITLIVSAFPESFPVVLITALATGSYRMAKKNAIVNRMSIIETLGETTVICSDKTGTITKGEMTTKKIVLPSGTIELSGVGYTSHGEFSSGGKPLNPHNNRNLKLFLESAVLCNDAIIERTGEDSNYAVLGSPTEAALLIMASKAGLFKGDMAAERIEEIPFSSERKFMSVLCSKEGHNIVYSKGAPEVLLKKCSHIQKGEKILRLTKEMAAGILRESSTLNSQAFRTIALAYKEAGQKDLEELEKGLVFLGFAALEDPPRDEVPEAIKECVRAGISVKLITGDHRDTALSIATQIGLSGNVMEGEEIDKITDDELSVRMDDIVIFARVRPEHKLRIVRALKSRGEVVTMTGDGINDAPALKEAQIGIAMGKSGTDVTRSVADLTLKDDNFATIVSAIKEGRSIFWNIRKFVSYQLSDNIAELLALFIGVLLMPVLGWPIPMLLALQILFMNLVTDNTPSITLAVNRPSHNIMTHPPRRNSEILNRSLVKLILFTGSFMAFMVILTFGISYLWVGTSIEYARSSALVCLILLEVTSAYNFRSLRKGFFQMPINSNPYLVYATLISLTATLLIIYSPLNTIFGTAPLAPESWLLLMLPPILLILVFDLLKNLNRKYRFLDFDS